ncbi:MAG TPA: glycosyl hydrolase family 18 protein [Saprospiraceae bacterium]|nr:glycosyl hydrolase family 18 protein [Saprospiraceae bacterium]
MNQKLISVTCFVFFSLFSSITLFSQVKNNFRIIAYYAGPSNMVDSFQTEQLTHIIFSFGHLKGTRFHIESADDSLTIQKMVAMKKQHPSLKVMLSLGGWSGCETCSDVFYTEKGRIEFAQSVKQASAYFKTDGIDLDWEYPAIKGFPGHQYLPEDKDNFTALLKALRDVNGKNFQISFAAGGFTTYIDSSIDWQAILPYTDFINIMTYDLVHGYSKVSGHHTPLFSTPQQIESTDHAVEMLVKAGVPEEKLVIGAAFYGRYFKIDEGYPVDLYQPCYFDHGFSSKHMSDSLSGFEIKWDDVANAPYAIHKERRLLATYDDERSIAIKTQYAVDHHLGGIMFWQLMDGKYRNGLLQVMYDNQ